MPFFRDLRKRRSSVRPGSKSPAGSDGASNGSNGTVPTTKSSSTLSSCHGTSTPASSVQPHASASNLGVAKPAHTVQAQQQRPVALSGTSNRNSVQGIGVQAGNGSLMHKAPLSAFAPRVLSISDNSWVHQKVLRLYGQIGDPSQPVDGTLVLYHHQDSFPTTHWPVSDSHFKALVHLNPGPNKLRLDFTSPKSLSHGNSTSGHSSYININFLPLVNAPPLQLVILLGRDSPGTYDAVPERVAREGNDLAMATRKFRMAAYLWQAFTGEQMYRNGFGRRCFRLEEEWQTGSLSIRDRESGQMRNEARVHVVRSSKTTAELRDLDVAQQYEKATRKGDLFSIAMDDVRGYFNPASGQTQYVSVLLLDSHWDNRAKTIRGHAALGGGGGGIQLAICGSHSIQSYPSCLEEVVPAFSDCTRTDTTFVANDCNEAGSNWESANIGIGAHLHETGHLFGCPHQEHGVMLRDYVRLNRTFLCREPYSTRSKSPGMRLCQPTDECTWHRLDTLRFRHHPCFRLPTDLPPTTEDGICVWSVDNGKVLVTAPSGVSFIEIYPEGDDVCHSWFEYLNGDAVGSGSPRQVVLTESDVRSRIGEDKKTKKLQIKVFSTGGGEHTVDDFGKLKSKDSVVKLRNGQLGFRGSQLGQSSQHGTRPESLVLHGATIQTKLLRSIRVFHGFAVDGLEFCYEDSTSQMFGKRGGTPGGSEFLFDTRRGEILLGFNVRAGLWIDGIEILTSLGRRSGFYGNAQGGSGHTLIPPRGYTVAGLTGSCGQWLDGFSLIITRG